jgi:hypothetical protein
MTETERSATATQDHDAIRKWVDKRGGHLAMVAATERNNQPGGMLRIDFDDPDGSVDTGLHRISWEEFFKVFDKNNLAFLRVDDDGSRFNKFVQAQDANS